MRDGEQHIQVWRRALEEQIGPDAGVLDELEGHLRDEVERRLRQGQGADEAVLAAIAVVGPPEKLATEFAKIARPWWPIQGVLALTFLVVVSALVFIGVTTFGRPWDGLLLTHVVSVTVGYALSYAIGILALCYALRRPVRELTVGQQTTWARTLTRSTAWAFGLTLLGVLLGGVWADRHWGRFWNGDARELGGLLVLVWQGVLLVSLWRLARHMRWLICWGMLGNVVVTFAWFVTSILVSPDQLHAYGASRNWVPVVFVIVLVTHLMLMAAAVAPSGWLRRCTTS